MTSDNLRFTADGLLSPNGFHEGLFPDRDSIAAHIRPLSELLNVGPASSLYELFVNANPDSRQNVWSNKSIRALINMAKSQGLISQGASSVYGDYIRFTVEEDQSGRPIVGLILVGGMLPENGDHDQILRDIQVIYGITVGMTKADLETQIIEDSEWNEMNPDGLYRATPNVIHGYDGFYYQNVGEW